MNIEQEEKSRKGNKRKGERIWEEEVKNQSNNNEERKEKNSIFIRNLSMEAEEEDIEAVFLKVIKDLKILSIRIPRNPDGSKRGIAFMDLATKEMAEKC